MNLIICKTPFQAWLAIKIIQIDNSDNFFGVMMSDVENEKFYFYGEQLRKKCCDYKYVKISKLNFFKTILDILKLRSLIKNKSFNKIYLASIDNIFIQMIIPNEILHSAVKFYTFDDGTANILNTSFLYCERKESLVLRVFRYVFDIGVTLPLLKSQSVLHYTVYPDVENIIDNKKYVDIRSCIERGDCSDIGRYSLIKSESIPLRILLGQPVFDDVNKNIEIMSKVVDMYNIHSYFPHPREQYLVKGVSYINTPLIFEDYFFEVVFNKNFPKIEIFTFFSGAALNLAFLSDACSGNIKINVILVDGEMLIGKKIYSLFKEFNFKNIELVTI